MWLSLGPRELGAEACSSVWNLGHVIQTFSVPPCYTRMIIPNRKDCREDWVNNRSGTDCRWVLELCVPALFWHSGLRLVKASWAARAAGWTRGCHFCTPPCKTVVSTRHCRHRALGEPTSQETLEMFGNQKELCWFQNMKRKPKKSKLMTI